VFLITWPEKSAKLMIRRVIGTILKISRLKRYNDYHYIHAHRAKRYLNPRGKKCLVVGCAKGKDCTYFVKFGAKEVTGVDISDEIGKDFINPKVRYCKTSAEKMGEIQSNYFDLVYCVATMEHILRIDLVFSEMIRVTKQGGSFIV
jgi:ubiquinone/menaquinone biosynthesis C-methylase UbiE